MITIKDIKDYSIENNTDYLTDFLNDYFFYNNKKEEFKKEELEDLLDELTDKIIEFADGLVDIYNHKLLEWLKDNYSTYEDYIEEFGINNKNFDLMQTIRWAQFIEYERELRDEVEEFLGEFDLNIEL